MCVCVLKQTLNNKAILLKPNFIADCGQGSQSWFQMAVDATPGNFSMILELPMIFKSRMAWPHLYVR